MGAEDYQVVAEFSESVCQLVKGILTQFGFTPDTAPYGGAKSDYYIYEDENCFVESELSEIWVSLRFAVCQPDEVNRILGNIVWELKEVVSAFSFVDANVDPNIDTFQSAEIAGSWISENASQKRRYWFDDFGGCERKCRCRDAYNGVT